LLGHTAVRSQRANLMALRLGAQEPLSWVAGYVLALAVADGAGATAAVLSTQALRAGGWGHPHIPFVILTAALPLLWWASVALAGGYDPGVIGRGFAETRRVLRAGVADVAAVAILAYGIRNDVVHSYAVIALPATTAATVALRYGLRKGLHRRWRRGECLRRAVAVGHQRPVADLITELRRETNHGLSVVGACVAETPAPDDVGGVPVHGGFGQVWATVATLRADTVAVLSCPELSGPRLRELAWQLEQAGTDLYVVPAVLDLAAPRTSLRRAAGLPMLHVEHPTLSGPAQVVKGLLDRMIAVAALAVFSPLLMAIALAIRLSDGGPALFRQTRLGKDGVPFTLYKFRSMVVDAEKRRAHLESRNEVNGVLFKIRKDPRITRLGGWLRRWSLDELPQLLNVVRSEMSMIGPRPWKARAYEEAAMHDEFTRRRLAVKPGITGLWQVSGRADLPWEESVRLDVCYVDNWSFALDLRILWKTGQAVIRGSGAY
jgi:exopolysaccharide biosynthesis polyprenyl glycosylphosphotransferase